MQIIFVVETGKESERSASGESEASTSAHREMLHWGFENWSREW